MNKKLFPEIETIFYLTKPENTPISSSIVRDIFKHGGDVSQFIPKRMNLNK
jgi:pantetheine-phosphate adenylyltransferase